MENREPLYFRVADDLQRQIEARVYAPRDRMPSEYELCGLYQTSRLTVRRALAELESKGLIYRLHGVGTFVSPYRNRQSFGFGGFSERCEKYGKKPGAIVIQSGVVESLPKSVWMYQRTEPDIYPDGRYYFLERVRTMDEVRVMVERVYLPLYLYPRLETDYDPNRSLYAFLGELYQVKRNHTEAVVVPYQSTRFDEERYGFPQGEPLLHGFMTVWNQNNHILEYTNSLYRSAVPLRFTWEN